MSEASHLRRDFEALAEIGRDPAGGWSRPAFGPDEGAAHDWFLARAREGGLNAVHDPFGNAIARTKGEGPAIVICSHLDTVQNGGAYDGALGVLAGLEVARRITGTGGAKMPIEVIAFRDEEGRFGAFTGSRAMCGTLPLDRLGKMRAADGVLLSEEMQTAGFDPDKAGAAARDLSGIAACLELHIEQGRVLEEAGAPLGIVTAIAGQERLSIRFTGQPDHAGTTPMEMRCDAFAAAARFANCFRDLVLANGDGTARGTIGIVRVEPNQGNVVPAMVRLGLEIRDINAALVDRLARATEALADEVGAEFGVEASTRRQFRAEPVPMDENLREALATAAGDLDIDAPSLPSGANHDAGILGAHVPAAMLFVPSKDGRSHCPEEHTDWEPIEQAVNVLERAVRQIAGTERAADG